MCERAPPAKGKRSLPAGYQRPVLFLLIRGAAAQVFDQRRAALGVIALVQVLGEVEGMRGLLAPGRVEQAVQAVPGVAAAHRAVVQEAGLAVQGQQQRLGEAAGGEA